MRNYLFLEKMRELLHRQKEIYAADISELWISSALFIQSRKKITF